MSFNGSGTFLINSAGNPIVTATVISSSWANALASDLAAGLSNVICKDGQSTITANIPFGGFKATGLAVATATGDALSFGRAASITALTVTGLTGLVKANGVSAATVAVAGTDYIAPGTATNFTAKQSFTGTTTNVAMVVTNAAEVETISATAATGTIAYYLSTQSILYFTSSAAANWTINLTFASTPVTLDTVMSVGQSMTCTHKVTQGVTPKFNNVVQVDGTTSGVTTIWTGGAPSAGSASGVDVYSYNIVKTGSAAFTVFASVTQYKA